MRTSLRRTKQTALSGRTEEHPRIAEACRAGATTPDPEIDCPHWIESLPFDGLEVPHWIDGTVE